MTNRHCYHHNEMRAQKIGQVLGIGLRVAGRMVGQRLADNAQTGTTAPSVAAQGRTAGQKAGSVTKGVARGVGGFLAPFRRVGGILWLEVTGAFFLLFAGVFGFALWRNWANYLRDSEVMKIIVTGAVVLVFLYLGVSAFWCARKR